MIPVSFIAAAVLAQAAVIVPATAGAAPVPQPVPVSSAPPRGPRPQRQEKRLLRQPRGRGSRYDGATLRRLRADRGVGAGGQGSMEKSAERESAA